MRPFDYHKGGGGAFQKHMTQPRFLATGKIQLPLDNGGALDGN